MLRLYQSNRLEDLAAMLQKVQQTKPLSEPLLPEEIIVQSQGMRRFIGNYLAEHGGIAANIRFSLPAGFNWRLTRALLPDIPELSPFDTEVMRWRLLGLFVSDGLSRPETAQAQAALSGYLCGGGAAAYQLAGELADIFDQYLVYRPDWIDAWQRGKLLGLGGDEAWQAELWRFLNDGQTAPHRVEMWHRLEQALQSPPDGLLPERICVFGIAALAPMYLQLLHALAQHTEVHIFALNPASEYWGNIIEPAQILAAGGDADPAAAGHPLLASLGKQGRDFFNALAESEAHTDLSAYPEAPLSDSLLHRLQYGLQTLTLPDKTATLDDSIRIVCAHSPLRELQILKDRLLELLAHDPTLQPRDIAVLTPNIEPYAPYIEAVFGQESGRPLPYSVADVKLSRRRPLLHAAEQTLAIFESRFEADKILGLLDTEPVLQRFGLTREDLPLLHDTIEHLNIRWGWDETMRGGADPLFTWQQGLDRIILGWMLPDNGELWQNHAPWHTDPAVIPLLARLAAFLRRLARWRQTWQTPATVAVWTQRITDMLQDLFVQDNQARQDMQQLAQALARWRQETELARFGGELDCSVINRHLARYLGSRSEAGFLRGGITLCSMVPMRSLPFQTLCLLGLNDGQFPRNTRAAAFDLIARHPRRGDRARRDDDRYLFLEALLSARQHLHLSYVGRSIHNNEALAPSALLNELADCLADMTGQTASAITEQHTQQHPLQAYSPRYFDNSGLTSSRADYAAALNRPSENPAPFYTAPLTGDTPPQSVAHNDFLDFWKNPVRHWLRRNLDWRAPYHTQATPTNEPFAPTDERETAAAYTQARLLHQNFTDTAARLTARSLLPAGQIGALWRGQYETAAKNLDQTLLDSPPLPDTHYQYHSDGLTLHGSLTRLHRHGQIHLLDHRPNAPERTALLLQHLIYNAVRPEEAADLRSHWIQPDHTDTLPPIPQQHAQTLLDAWIAWWRTGQTQPLPYFPKTTLAAAEALLKNSKKSDTERRRAAHKAAYTAYFANKAGTPQADYPEVAQVFGRNNTPPIDEDPFWLLAEHLAHLLAATEQTEQTPPP